MCRLIYDVISDIILLNFTNFTTSSPFWTTRIDFYEICIRSKVLWYDQRKILAICFFDTMSVFLIYVVVNDVILLCFTDSTTSSPFWATSLYSYGIFIVSKVVQHDQRKILAIYFYVTMTYEDLLTSYCSVSLILPLHCLLSIVTWFLENVYLSPSYSTWSEEYFGKMNFWYQVSFLTKFHHFAIHPSIFIAATVFSPCYDLINQFNLHINWSCKLSNCKSYSHDFLDIAR